MSAGTADPVCSVFPHIAIEELLPFVILFLGLPLTEWARRYFGIDDEAEHVRLLQPLSVLILSIVGVWTFATLCPVSVTL